MKGNTLAKLIFPTLLFLCSDSGLAQNKALDQLLEAPAASLERQEKSTRLPQPDSITFTNSAGVVVTNAEVVRVVKGAYIVWRQGASGGMVKLSELPEELRARFDYDPATATTAYSAEEKRKAAIARDQAAATHSVQFTPAPDTNSAAASSPAPYYGASDSSSASSGGRVSVKGYTKKDGTYVAPHTRSAPSKR